jgi:predicted nucleic acid-binding protein
MTPGATTEALERLDGVLLASREVQPVERVRRLATRLLRVHPLRTADALQLAAALAASEERPETLTLVTLDDRLALVAQREGFPVLQIERT